MRNNQVIEFTLDGVGLWPTSRQLHALELRDAAARLTRAEGTAEYSSGLGHYLSWAKDGLKIGCRAPNNEPPTNEMLRQRLVLMHASGRLPFGIDMWEPGRKVLNIEWDRTGFYLVSFRRGEWEQQLRKAADDLRQVVRVEVSDV